MLRNATSEIPSVLYKTCTHVSVDFYILLNVNRLVNLQHFIALHKKDCPKCKYISLIKPVTTEAKGWINVSNEL